MYKLIFELKQHTPLIHFQHSDEGATLRASEVKPKLDEFIWGQWINKESTPEAAFDRYKEYVTGYDEKKKPNIFSEFKNNKKLPLNYKLSMACDTSIVFKKEIISSEENLMLYKSVNGAVKSFEKGLIDEIRMLIEDFFICTNFGKRTSKGYGSFTVSKMDLIEISIPRFAEISKTLAKKYDLLDGIDIGSTVANKLYEFDASSLFSIKFPQDSTENDRKEFSKRKRFIYSIPERILNNIQINELWFHEDILRNVQTDFSAQVETRKNQLIREFRQWSQLVENTVRSKLNHFVYHVLPFTFYIELANQIELSNRILKSGVNPGRTSDYIKSKLFLFFIENGEVWEKRLIKKMINSLTSVQRTGVSLDTNRPPSLNAKEYDNSWDDSFSLNQYFFIRALLGLPELYEFKTTDNRKKFVVTFKNPDGDVERFQSPVLYKYIDWNLYVLLKKDFSMIMNKPFLIFFSVKQRTIDGKWQTIGDEIELTGSENGNSLSTIYTPKMDSNQLGEFKYFLKDYFINFNYGS